MNKVDLTIDSRSAIDVLIWVKQNCPGYITNHGYENDDGEEVYVFYFETEEETNWFKLRWL